MDAVAALYFALIVPVCLWLLALMCLGVWWGLGRPRYLLWYASASFSGGLALGIQTLTSPQAFSHIAPWIAPIYILTIVGLTWAMSLRLRIHMRWRWTLTVAVIIELLAIYFSHVDENLSARLTVMAVGLAALLGQLVPGLWRLRWRELTFIDRGLACSYGAYIAFVVLRPALLVWNPESFAQPFALGVSVIWLVTLYGSVIMGIISTGFFLAAAGLDSVQQLRTERDQDPLTGLLNRRALLAPWSQLASTGGVVAICDLDHFKRINDTWGHPAGDAVLQTLAELLMGNVRPSDRVGRYGGEEFVVVLQGMPWVAACQRLEFVRSQVEHTRWPRLPDGTVVTLSVGAVQLQPEESLQEAIARADVQLYAAKQGGRNRVCCLDAHGQQMTV